MYFTEWSVGVKSLSEILSFRVLLPTEKTNISMQLITDISHTVISNLNDISNNVIL